MKKILLFLGWMLTFLVANELKSQYVITHNELYSTDLFSNAPRFLIASMGDGFEMKIKSSEIIDLFARNGVRIKSKDLEITVRFKTPPNLKGAAQEVKKDFLQYYKAQHFEVDSIQLKPLGKEIESIRVIEVKLSEAMMKRKIFTLPIVVQKDQKRMTLSFLCQVNAGIEVYIATQDIRAGAELNERNARRQRVSFEGFLNLPINQEQFNSSSAKSYIKQGQIITEQKIRPKIIVLKGEIMEVSMQGDGINIQIRMEAMQNGSLGEVINAKNLESKKVVKVKIVGKSRGMIL